MMTFLVEEGDWVLDARNGQAVTVTGAEKARQDVREALTTDVQPNGSGCALRRRLGQLDVTDGDLKSDVRTSIEALAALQRIARGARSQAETIVFLRSCRVTVVPPTQFSLQIVVQTQGRAVEVNL